MAGTVLKAGRRRIAVSNLDKVLYPGGRFTKADVIIVGAGFAGLSAAIYLGRSHRDALVIDAGKSMGRWEPKVENYLGFPAGIGGRLLLQRARRQAGRYRVRFKHDFIESARACGGRF